MPYFRRSIFTMKISVALYTALFCVAVSSVAFSQISQGGKPLSFSTKEELANNIPMRVMPYVDIDFLKQEDEINTSEAKPFRFGANIDVDINLSNSGLWETLANGDRLWRLAIKSEGALSLNLVYNDFQLPEGGRFYIYSPKHTSVLGAFTNFNNREDRQFGTDILHGSEAIFEYLEPKSKIGEGHIGINRVVHGYRGFNEYFNRKNIMGPGGSGACEVNVNCPVADEWQVEKRSVCIILSGGNGICTGAMINDVPESGTPYFLTANHCTQGATVGSWVFRFNYETTACTGSTEPATSQSISGCTLKARSSNSDFALLELSSIPPASYGAVYAGWSREGIVVDSAFAIHHPAGDLKKFSKAQNQTQSGTFNGGTGVAQCWRVGQWTLGVTEGGSSGSPLFDPNHRIIGQLFGGPSSCSATPDNKYDYYGKFSESWDSQTTAATRLQDWLDPQNLAPLTVDAYDPTNIVYTLDAGLTSLNSPSASVTCNNKVVPSFTLKNNGTDTLHTAQIVLTLNGVNVDTISYSGSPLATGQVTVLNTDTINFVVGGNTLIFSIISVNGIADQNSNNNSVSGSISFITPTSVPAPVQNGFETPSFPSSGFSIINPDNGLTWTATSAASGYGQSVKSARLEFFEYVNAEGEEDYLVLPYTNFSNVLLPVGLKFDVAYSRASNQYFDSLRVAVSTDCGENWEVLYRKGNTQLSTNNGADIITSGFVPSTTQWRTDSINMNQYFGLDDVLIRFEAVNNIYIWIILT